MSVATPRSAHTINRLMPVLTPLYHAQHGSFCAPADGTYRCGTESASEFCLESSGAEPAHCVFERQAGSFSVSRMDGRVWINDLPVRSRSPLADGDVISLGPVTFKLSFEESPSFQSQRAFHSPLTSSNFLSPSFLAARSLLSDAASADATPSHEIEAASDAQFAPETLIQMELYRDLEQQQKLLSLRQQQLDDLLQTVRDRERNTQSRLVVIEERALQISTQWNELLQKQQQLVAHEGELAQCSQDIQRQLHELTEKQQLHFQKAEENARSREAVEQALQELTSREQTLLEWERGCAETEQQIAARAAAAETHTAEQMAVIAAQHEAAVHERQLAIEAQTELRQAQQSVQAQQQQLWQRQAEIDSRADELAARLQSLKAIHRSHRTSAPTVSDTAVSQESAAESDQRAASLAAEGIELEQRWAELATAEIRFAETQHAAAAIVQAAESERQVLHSANKDLLCERNSLSQLRQDLASREAGITEREVFVARQLEEMRSRFTVQDQRAAELNRRETEIDTRAADVHRRVQQFKTEQQSRAASAPATTAETDAEQLAVRQQLEELQHSLAAQTDEHASLLSEREALLSAVRELQKALQDARQDVEDACQVKSQATLQQQRLDQALQKIGDNSANLQLSESRWIQAEEQLAELTEALRTRDIQIQRLKEDMQDLAAAESASPDPAAHQLEERHLAQERLQDQLISAEELIRQRDELICDLRNKLQNAAPAAGATSGSETFELLSRELDERADVLDRREEKLRERSRKIEQSESDLDAQRHQLLQARQQLEQARAEIQLTMRQKTEPARPFGDTLPNAPFEATGAAAQNSESDDSPAAETSGGGELSESDESTYDASDDMRSELAGLFALHKPRAQSLTTPPMPLNLMDSFDLSEPAGTDSRIIFHFDDAAAPFAETALEVPANTESEPVREENSDDFVRDYMEQLLSRNRTAAGNVLPRELKEPEKRIVPAVAPVEQPVVKAGPKVTSYIEQYMAGKMGNLESGEALSMTNSADAEKPTEVVESEQPSQQRQKMDLKMLKENMNSFRALSTKSVQNALASHAMKVKNDGANIRKLSVAGLILMTLVVGMANAEGAIDSPLLTWVMLTSAIAIGSELIRRYSLVAGDVQGPRNLEELNDPSSTTNSAEKS